MPCFPKQTTNIFVPLATLSLSQCRTVCVCIDMYEYICIYGSVSTYLYNEEPHSGCYLVLFWNSFYQMSPLLLSSILLEFSGHKQNAARFLARKWHALMISSPGQRGLIPSETSWGLGCLLPTCLSAFCFSELLTKWHIKMCFSSP